MKFLVAASLMFLSHLLYADNQQFLTELKEMMGQKSYQVNINEMNITKNSTKILRDITEILPLYLATENAFSEKDEHIRFPDKKQRHPIIPIMDFAKVLNKYMHYLDSTHNKKEKTLILEKILNDTQQLMYHTQKTIHYLVSMNIYINLLKSQDCKDKDIRNILQNYPPKNADYYFEVFEADMDITFQEGKQSIIAEYTKHSSDKKAFMEIVMVEVDKLFAIRRAKILKALRANSEKAIQEYEAYYDKLRAKNIELIDSVFLTFDERVQTTAFLLVSILSPMISLTPYRTQQEVTEDYNAFLNECP